MYNSPIMNWKSYVRKWTLRKPPGICLQGMSKSIISVSRVEVPSGLRAGNLPNSRQKSEPSYLEVIYLILLSILLRTATGPQRQIIKNYRGPKEVFSQASYITPAFWQSQ